MEKTKSTIIVLAFAIFPLAVLIHCQSTSFANFSEGPDRQSLRHWKVLQSDVGIMLNKTENLSQYQMKEVGLD